MLEHLLSFKGLRSDLALVSKYIDEFLKTDMDTGLIADVFDAVRDTRGKMLRPILLLLASYYGADEGMGRERLCKIGAMVEMVHMASLVHDDIIDDSPLRRGRETVQARFGKDIAVYAGDFLISRVIYHAAEEALREDVSEDIRKKASRAIVIFGNLGEELCRGELGQKLYRWDTEMTVERYLKNIKGKTAALFKAAAGLGALESDCEPEHVDNLAAIGENIGYMFQMRDDLLDFVSSEQQEAKPISRDFSSGIYTLPVIHALGKEGYGGRLREIAKLNAGTKGYLQYMDEVRRLVHASGGIEFAKKQIETRVDEVKRQLAALPKVSASDAMGELISFVSSLQR